MLTLIDRKEKERGAATLVMALIMIVLTTLIIIFAANLGVMQSKSISNQARSSQAFQAAEAGLEFGVAYLIDNSATIIANPSGGYVNYGSADSNLTNVTLPNNAGFSVVYTNPIANNYDLITITSTGYSDDGTSTAVVSQQAYAGISSFNDALLLKGNLVSSGNVKILGPNGVHAGGNITQSGNVQIDSMISNDATLHNMSSNTLFNTVFGASKAQVQSQSNYYANTSGLNYNGLTGKNWINSNVVISGNKTIGSAANPVLMIVNGNFISSGNVTIYGLLYVTGNIIMSGNVSFNGGAVAEGNVTMSGSVGAYNASAVSAYTAHSFAKIPGSWRDF